LVRPPCRSAVIPRPEGVRSPKGSSCAIGRLEELTMHFCSGVDPPWLASYSERCIIWPRSRIRANMHTWNAIRTTVRRGYLSWLKLPLHQAAEAERYVFDRCGRCGGKKAHTMIYACESCRSASCGVCAPFRAVAGVASSELIIRPCPVCGHGLGEPVGRIISDHSTGSVGSYLRG